MENLDISAIDAAAGRLIGHIRRTPILSTAPHRLNLDPAPAELVLKLENLQRTGSFKIRGAVNKIASLPEDARRRGFVTASGGNHGLGVACAAAAIGAPATVFLPASTPEAKRAALAGWGARVVVAGAVWDDANQAALALAAAEGLTYVHPFADPAVVAGQGTIAREILTDAPETEVIVAAIGGGGLISGLALAAKAIKPSVRVIGVEPEGAPTLHASLAAGRPVTLDAITTRAGTLAPRRSEALNLDLIRRHVDDIVLVSDDAMAAAAAALWTEFGLGVELSAAAAIAALAGGMLPMVAGRRVVAVICGAGRDGII